MTTIQPPSLPVLKDLGEEAGLDAKVFQLLLDHGITNSGTFFYTFQDPVAVKKLLTPATVGEGVKLTSGTSVKLDDVQFMVALSVVAHMVDEIRVAKAKRDIVSSSPPALPRPQPQQSRRQARRPRRCYRRGTGRNSWPISSPRKSGGSPGSSRHTSCPVRTRFWLVWCTRGSPVRTPR